MSFEFFTSDFLQEGYENLSAITSVVVTVPYEDMSKVSMMIPSNNIQLINKPIGFNYEVITSGVRPLFVGPSDEIASLALEDIIAVVDASQISGTGDIKLTVSFTIPSYPDIWSAAVSGVLSQRVTVTVTRNNE
jgi:hypothetical protein